MGLSSEARFGFGYTVRLRTFCSDVRESIANAGMRDRFWDREAFGKAGRKAEAL